MTMRRCLDCKTLTNSTRCPPCERRRHTTMYGGQHQAERARWAPIVAAGGVLCSRCAQPIDATDNAWDLDHRPGGRRPSHNVCNRRAGGRHEP